jgi:trk system potassium uptake protein TrkH
MLLVVLGTTMLFPLLVDLAVGSSDWQVFALSSGLTLLIGGSMALASYQRAIPIERRTGYLLTVSAWCVVAAFGSLPLVFSPLNLSLTDAAFETLSGLTTTGSTVLVGLDAMAPGLLLWRSLLQWIGGAGIVVTAIVLLPFLGIGGMQLFHMESSDVSGKPTYSAYQMASLTIGVYFALSVACAVAYAAAGMSAFDAINHAMTTIATGGYSTHDASIGFYGSVAIEMVGIVFMLSGAFPLIWYGILLTHSRGTLNQERQIPILLAIFAIAVALVALWNVLTNDMAPGTALRVSAFNVASILTDTGYATADYSTWGSFAVGMFFMLLFIGGCAGSTSGAIKIFRWQLLFAGLDKQLRVMLSPNRVTSVRFGGRNGL